MTMQSRDNDQMLQLRVQLLDNQDNDAFMKQMIAMPVQCYAGMFHAQMK